MFRIGNGYDVHRLVEGRKLILGGVEIPHPTGLDGHSDADVLLHALCDAILGACGAGDLGRHFPDSDPEWKGVSSLFLLGKVGEICRGLNFRIVNTDAIIVAQKPKLAPFLDQMKTHIAASLDIPPGQVSIKATTTERLGFAGREEGIAAYAVVLVAKNG
ncbi:MAG: 2-C-methyl-D-erythritol 2,4-cyclodiphosphate synthase [Nitrospinales bacterium]